MIPSFFKTIWYLAYPPYRRKVNRDWGYVMCFNAGLHMMMRDDADRNDLDAARLLRNCMEKLS